MAKINKNFLDLKASYLFIEIAKRVREYEEANPDKEIIRLGIGDVTRPLIPKVVETLKEASDDMGTFEGFKGYGPEQGYAFLRELISEHEYGKLGVNIGADEVFISDGAKSDCGNIGDIFAVDNTVGICDPVYPVYNDTNIMGGRGKNMVFLKCNEENGFLPEIPEEKLDLIYLCFPNNPTGVVGSKEYLKQWVDYANKNGSVILFDSAYESFITDENLPRSIFEIEGAKTCAVEFRSYSKTAGFTGVRCAYTVIPNDLVVDGVKLNTLWNRRQGTKFNGTSYVVQRAAAAIYTEEGQKQIKENIDYYLRNAKHMKDTLQSVGLEVFGGDHAPYVWCKTPKGMKSWEYFDFLLEKCQIVATPGSGFGDCGEGYIRFSAFGDFEKTKIAMLRVKANL
ncbi:MAG: LL-diaminopimelate aminotransferase [Lachnospirales bacterium]